MKALGLKFRVDDLTATPRTVAGVLSQAVLDETLPGLIGKLGYRPLGDAAIDAEVYLSAGAEIVVKGMVKVAVGLIAAVAYPMADSISNRSMSTFSYAARPGETATPS